ncbi:ABC transporter ATP-binding protein [Pseudocalidococcus azoricus]
MQSIAFPSPHHEAVHQNVILSVRGLEMTYYAGHQATPVLKGIDLDVKAGDIELLMGPSGSGKTTLLSIMAGILTPTAGHVRLFGQDITSLPKRQLAQFRLQNIGFIFQGFNLFPALTAAENIGVALQLKGVPSKQAKTQVMELLERVGLAERADHLPEDLSGGQKQRVAIARALAGHPKLILADEPTAALDSQSGRRVIEILGQLAKQDGCTVVMVTHDPRIVDIADRVVYVEDGQITPPSSPIKGKIHSESCRE